METRGCKSKQAKLALIENELGNYVKHDEVEVHQEEDKNKAFPAIFLAALSSSRSLVVRPSVGRSVRPSVGRTL